MRVLKKLGQRYLGKTFFQESPDNRDLYMALRNSKISSKYLKILKEYSILDGDLKLEDVSNQYLGRIITLGKIIERKTS